MTKENPEPLKIHWATPPKDLVGNALGYNTHIKYLKSFAEQGGHTVEDHDSNIVLHIISADHFKPIPGKFNILFTMWECLDVPITYQEALKKADLIIVPCQFCRDIFKPYTSVPIEVCWHGTDITLYKFHDRTNQGIIYKYKESLFGKIKTKKRFRFLWVGAPNPRKGYQEICQVTMLAEKFSNIEIYVKTTCPKVRWRDALKSFARNWKLLFDFSGGHKKYFDVLWTNLLKIPTPFTPGTIKYFGHNKNVIFDSRMLSKAELVELYNSANCFLFPTWGEGWGLTLSEAMATGCPCIATPVTGVTEFFDKSVGYPLKYEVHNIDLKDYNIFGCRVFHPNPLHLAEMMIYVVQNYREALRKGRMASERMSKLTWQNSAARLAEIIRGHYVDKC